MQHLGHYGLHRIEGNIAVLAQQNRVDHVLGVPMKIEAKISTRRPCTHDINLEETVEDNSLLYDPLFNAMLPLPKPAGGTSHLLDDTTENHEVVRKLVDLSSPRSFSVLFPVWMYPPKQIASFLQDTNVQPLVITDIKWSHAKLVAQLAEAAQYMPRTLLFLAQPGMVGGQFAKRLSTYITSQTLEDLPLKEIGAHHLKTRMIAT